MLTIYKLGYKFFEESLIILKFFYKITNQI